MSFVCPIITQLLDRSRCCRRQRQPRATAIVQQLMTEALTSNSRAFIFIAVLWPLLELVLCNIVNCVLVIHKKEQASRQAGRQAGRQAETRSKERKACAKCTKLNERPYLWPSSSDSSSLALPALLVCSHLSEQQQEQNSAQ